MRRKQTLLLGVLALTSISALSGCNQSSGADENTLTVVCLNKGYGKEWIEDLAAKWEEANPGKKINLDANAQAATIISKHLASKNNPDDLYISVGKSWLTYAGSGKFASLDDLMEEEVDGKKVKDKVNSEFSTSLQQTGIDGQKHTYHLPWTRGIGGIYYNAKLLRQVQGWENKVPSTTAELLQLVSDIKSAKLTAGVDLVKPFVFTGRNADYFDYTVLSWWGQLAGKEAISEFLKYSSASSFDYTNLDGAYSKLKTAVDTWYAIFGDASNYVSGSLSKSNDDAQQDFLNGKAVMMMDCDWIYNEMLGYNFTFESKVISGDHRGRTIGFPTINQHLPEGLIVPKFGVYESRAFVDGKEYKSFTNIGIRPTWRVDEPLCETHIFDFNGDLYGETVRVELVDYKRGEKIFSSVEELKEQLNYDKSSIV